MAPSQLSDLDVCVNENYLPGLSRGVAVNIGCGGTGATRTAAAVRVENCIAAIRQISPVGPAAKDVLQMVVVPQAGQVAVIRGSRAVTSIVVVDLGMMVVIADIGQGPIMADLPARGVCLMGVPSDIADAGLAQPLQQPDMLLDLPEYLIEQMNVYLGDLPRAYAGAGIRH